MALNQDTISINMATGINDKIDPKIALPNQTATLQNARFTKDKRIEKRYGMSSKSTNTQNLPADEDGIGASLAPTKVFEHGNQLCMINKGDLYSFMQGQNKWLYKGHCVPVDMSVDSVKGGNNTYDIAKIGNITAVIGENQTFTDAFGYPVTLGSQTGFLTVTENATGNVLLNTTIANPRRLVAFSDSLWVIYLDATAGASGYVMKAQKIDQNTGVLGTTVTLASDVIGSGISTYPPAKMFSVTLAPSTSAAGQVAFIAFPSQNLGAGTYRWSVISMQSSGTVPALGRLDTTFTFVNPGIALLNSISIYLDPSVDTDRFWITRTNVTSGTVPLFYYVNTSRFVFTSTTYSIVGGFEAIISWIPKNTDPQNSPPNFVTQITDPTNSDQLYVIFDTKPLYAATGMTLTPLQGSWFEGEVEYSQDAYVFYAIIDISLTKIQDKTTYGSGYSLAARAIKDTVRETIYVPCASYSNLSAGVYLMDLLKGKESDNTYTTMKVLDGLASPPTALSSTISPSSNVYQFTNNGYVVNTDFAPDYAQSSQYFSNTTHLSGGLLWAYDGETLSEHNFLQAPELMSVFMGQTYLSINVVAVGSATVNETFDIFCPIGSAFVRQDPGSLQYGYITFNTTFVAYYIWFSGPNGVGTDPALAGKVGIKVQLEANDSSFDVASKIAFEVNSAAIQYDAYIYADTATSQEAQNVPTTPFKVRLIYNTKIAVPAPTVGGYITKTGYREAGNYEYVACYRWTDKNGQVYRSAPTTGITKTAVANDRTTILVWAPPLTNKIASTVYVELYRTSANGGTLQLVTQKAMSETDNRVWFDDSFTDADINDNEVLYTTGGILPNYNIGACKSVSFFKSRLVVTPVDDELAVYYSKTAQANSPIDFAAELYFREDSDQDPVTAAVQMDDKLIVFKGIKTYAHSGDGANDVGTGVTLSPAILVATDVGCINPNSIVLYPNGLMFKSEKGLYNLDRGISTSYLGAPVEDYNSNTISGAVLMENVSELRYFSSNSEYCLVYNYFFNRWDTFTFMTADSTCMYGGKPVRVTNAGQVFLETTNYYDEDGGSITPYSMFWKSPWLKLKGIQDFQRIYELEVLGEYLSPHIITVSVQYDYDTTTLPDVYSVEADTLVQGTFPGDSVYQYQVNLVRQKCQAIQISILETPSGLNQASLYLNDLSATVGLKRGLNKLPARKQV